MSRKLLWICLGALGLVGAAFWAWGWLPRGGAEPLVPSTDVMPEGFWIRTTPLAKGVGRGGEDLAQVLSLPYTAGGAPAPGLRGVIHHDASLAWQGVNLYVSGHGPEAILIDMDGGFLHRWRRPFEEVFPGRPPGPETGFFRRARLLEDGSILALFQGGGLARLEARSEIIWASPGAFFNDLDVVGDRIFVVGKVARAIPSLRSTEVLEDFVTVLDLGTGERLEQIPLLPAFHRGGLASGLEPLPDHADIFHTNTITVLGGSRGTAPEPGPGTFDAAVRDPGNLLISLREVSTVAVLDAAKEEILWAQRGPWVAQHEPVLMPGGELLVFDNQGGTDGRSRLLIWDPQAEVIRWTFEHPGFHTRQAGAAAPLPNGNILITSSEQGRAFEIAPGVSSGAAEEPKGGVVWELVSPHRAGDDNEWVASLFEAQRLPMEVLRWIGRDLPESVGPSSHP